MQLQCLSRGHTCGTLFQLACIRSRRSVSAIKEEQGHAALRTVRHKNLAGGLFQEQLLVIDGPHACKTWQYMKLRSSLFFLLISNSNIFKWRSMPHLLPIKCSLNICSFYYLSL